MDEAGWDGTFPEDAPGRLADMAAVEAIARNRVPLTQGERLQRVAEALAQRHTQIEQVELHTPFGDLSHTWQRVVGALPWVPAAGIELAPAAGIELAPAAGIELAPAASWRAGPRGSDLARVQAKLLSMIDRDSDPVEARESLEGDRSILVVKSASKDLSADAIAEFLLESGRSSKTLLLAERDGIVLDNALERRGLPRCGFRWFTRFRPATQVLKLAIALVWKPVEPHRILRFLLHPSGPLPRWVRWRLADAVAASPGIGGPEWVDTIDGIARTMRERYEAEESAS